MLAYFILLHCTLFGLSVEVHFEVRDKSNMRKGLVEDFNTKCSFYLTTYYY